MSKKIESYWMRDGKSVNQDHQTKMASCMTKNNIAYSIPFLIYAGTDIEQSAVVSCLGL